MLGIGDANKDESVNDFNVDPTTPPFQDAISSISWAPAPAGGRSTMFAVGLWDGSVRVFNVENPQGVVVLSQKFEMKVGAPIMGITWNGQGNGLFAGCADGMVRAIDLQSTKSVDIGKHASPVKDVYFIPSQNAIMSTSYDKCINIWQMGNSSPIFSLPLPHKLYVSDFQYPIFAGGLSEEKILLFDITNIQRKVILDSSLGKESQIQSIAISPDC